MNVACRWGLRASGGRGGARDPDIAMSLAAVSLSEEKKVGAVH